MFLVHYYDLKVCDDGTCSWSITIILHVNDVPQLTEGRTIMCAEDTSILNIGRNINELQKTTPEYTGLLEQYFETIYL
jgi:hypothetical protein